MRKTSQWDEKKINKMRKRWEKDPNEMRKRWEKDQWDEREMIAGEQSLSLSGYQSHHWDRGQADEDLCHKDLFCYLSAENVEVMSKCSYIQNMHGAMLTNTEAALWSEWETRYESYATHSLSASISLSVSHIFGTIAAGFSSAVWSCFTPVRLHWLPFCPISPLWHVFVSSIMTGRKRPSTSGALMAARCQHCSSTPHSSVLDCLNKPWRIVCPLSAGSHAEWWASIHNDWRTMLHNGPRVEHTHSQPKEGSQHNGDALKRKEWIKRCSDVSVCAVTSLQRRAHGDNPPLPALGKEHSCCIKYVDSVICLPEQWLKALKSLSATSEKHSTCVGSYNQVRM